MPDTMKELIDRLRFKRGVILDIEHGAELTEVLDTLREAAHGNDLRLAVFVASKQDDNTRCMVKIWSASFDIVDQGQEYPIYKIDNPNPS